MAKGITIGDEEGCKELKEKNQIGWFYVGIRNGDTGRVFGVSGLLLMG